MSGGGRLPADRVEIGRLIGSRLEACGARVQLLGDNALLVKHLDTVDLYIFRVLRIQPDIGQSTAVGLMQSIRGFFFVVSANWIVKRMYPEGAIYLARSVPAAIPAAGDPRDVINAIRKSTSLYRPEVRVPEQSARMATMMVTIGAIIVVYPFAQRYFVKGIIVGGDQGMRTMARRTAQGARALSSSGDSSGDGMRRQPRGGTTSRPSRGCTRRGDGRRSNSPMGALEDEGLPAGNALAALTPGGCDEPRPGW